MTNFREAQEKLSKSQAELESAMSGTDSKKAGDDEAKSETSEHAAQIQEYEDPKLPSLSRGIQTLFRAAYRVQMDLTSLADNKANMMISINGIIMSIIIAAVAPKLDANPWLLVPTVLLLVGSAVSIVYAILAARPRVSHEHVSLSDLRHSNGNILFFGNFANMLEDEFVVGMEDVMADRVLVYESMIRNIHGLGVVLQRKFALLKMAYTAFMIALLSGVLSFLVVFFWVLRQVPAA